MILSDFKLAIFCGKSPCKCSCKEAWLSHKKLFHLWILRSDAWNGHLAVIGLRQRWFTFELEEHLDRPLSAAPYRLACDMRCDDF